MSGERSIMYLIQLELFFLQNKFILIRAESNSGSVFPFCLIIFQSLVPLGINSFLGHFSLCLRSLLLFFNVVKTIKHAFYKTKNCNMERKNCSCSDHCQKGNKKSAKNEGELHNRAGKVVNVLPKVNSICHFIHWIMIW